MKVFGKWLVIGETTDGKVWVASSFMTKAEAIEALDMCVERLGNNFWMDCNGTKYRIMKNTKEYK